VLAPDKFSPGCPEVTPGTRYTNWAKLRPLRGGLPPRAGYHFAKFAAFRANQRKIQASFVDHVVNARGSKKIKGFYDSMPAAVRICQAALTGSNAF